MASMTSRQIIASTQCSQSAKRKIDGSLAPVSNFVNSQNRDFINQMNILTLIRKPCKCGKKYQESCLTRMSLYNSGKKSPGTALDSIMNQDEPDQLNLMEGTRKCKIFAKNII